MAGDVTLDAVCTVFQEDPPDPTHLKVVCSVDSSAASWTRLTQLHDSSLGHAILPLLTVTGMRRSMSCVLHMLAVAGA